MIGVNLSEPREKVKAYVAWMKLTFPIVIDRTGKVARDYGVPGTPAHYLIDRAEVVRAVSAGSRNWNGPAAHAAIRALLEAPLPRASKVPARQDRADSPPERGAERR